jgi:hypothetical protein
VAQYVRRNSLLDRRPIGSGMNGAIELPRRQRQQRIDSGRVIGAHQADSLKDHTPLYSAPTYAVNGPTGGGGPPNTVTSSSTASASPSTGAAAETRPRNNAKLACIKF